MKIFNILYLPGAQKHPYLPAMKYLFLLLAAAIVLLPSCTKFEDIRFVGVENIKMEKIGVNETTANMHLIFNNPNKVGATLNTAGGKAWIQDMYVGDFLLTEDVKIPAKSNFSVPVHLKLNLRDLVKNSVVLLFQDSVTLKVDGTARLNKGSFSKNVALKYSGKQPSGALLGNLKF